MRCSRPAFLPVLLLWILAACGSAQVTRAGGDDVVVLVSFDGMRHDYLDRGLTPNFTRVANAGVRAHALIPVFPSKTFPNHHSISTGMYAEHHGMVGNELFDPVLGEYRRNDPEQGRWYGGEPIWVTAERQGVRSASFFWVASDTEIQGRRPTYWKQYDGRVPNEARVDTVLAWLAKPASERPRLVLMYFSLMDDAGHRHGPDSPQVDSALAVADALLGRLLAGISRTPAGARTNLILVSDHGMTAVDPSRVVAMDSLVDLAGVRLVVQGAYSTLYFEGDTVRRNAVVAALRPLPHARVYTRDSIPARFHWRDHPRIPDVLILADEGWSVGLRKDVERTRAGGTHGYDPALPSMQGIFLAMGPRIRSNLRIAAFENVHVHPFMATLLGIDPAEGIDGRFDVLAPVLRYSR